MICESIKLTKPDMSVIPAFASLNESAYYIIEANEKDFTELIKSIGIHELGIFESTGSVLLYEKESEESQDVEEKKTSWIVKVWARVKALFEKFLTMIKETCAKFAKANADKAINKDTIAANIAKLPDDWKYTRYSYEVLKTALENGTGIDSSVGELKDKIDKYLKGDKFDVNEIRKEIRGEKETITKSQLRSVVQTIVRVVTNYDNASKAVKAFYKETQKYFDDLIKEQKNADNSKEELNKMKIEANNKVLYANVLLTEYYNMFIENVKLISKLANMKDQEVEGGNNVDESAFDSELSSLFDWTY